MKNLTEQQIKEMLNMTEESGSQNTSIKKARFSTLQPSLAEDGGNSIEILNEIMLDMEVELGSTQLTLKEVVCLHEGEVITLDRLAGDTVDLMANKQWLALGEVLVLNEVLGIRINSFNKNGEMTGKGGK